MRLIPAADWLTLRIKIGIPVLDNGALHVAAHRLVLDMKRGLGITHGRQTDPALPRAEKRPSDSALMLDRLWGDYSFVTGFRNDVSGSTTTAELASAVTSIIWSHRYRNVFAMHPSTAPASQAPLRVTTFAPFDCVCFAGSAYVPGAQHLADSCWPYWSGRLPGALRLGLLRRLRSG